jgi:hypothetical protein
MNQPLDSSLTDDCGGSGAERLVRQGGRDVREGAAPSADDAKLEAETVALRLLDLAP